MVTRTFHYMCRSKPRIKGGQGIARQPECEGLGIAKPDKFFPIQYEKRDLFEDPWKENCATMKNLSTG